MGRRYPTAGRRRKYKHPIERPLSPGPRFLTDEEVSRFVEGVARHHQPRNPDPAKPKPLPPLVELPVFFCAICDMQVKNTAADLEQHREVCVRLFKRPGGLP